MNVLFREFLKHPLRVGACCPSSPALCREITSDIDLENAGMVAELGPGTGVITEEIRRKLRRGAHFAAVELDEKMAADIESRFAGVTVFRGCASHLDDMLSSRSLPRADVVISGLPFAIFPDELQERILQGVVRSLIPGGAFATFAYLQGCILPAGIRFRRKLETSFARVETSPVVWNNMPPAFIYRCRTAK